ncbi:hypothetical protein [Brevibacillus laterosporus]|uniref:hypothetical protein n=1 Tax=Brevibacillus laterosporus TaxID=1465 RepID=UPI00215BCF5F|nr:hypothetical protein [Brevibacillus laterosporus]MCR8994690.1 hypothetical protein [Brevibacillus laterosporus]
MGYSHQQQWIIVEKETGNIIGDKVYISKKMAETHGVRGKTCLGKEGWKAVELSRDLLKALDNECMTVTISPRGGW